MQEELNIYRHNCRKLKSNIFHAVRVNSKCDLKSVLTPFLINFTPNFLQADLKT
jgi:hypothetical protein